MVTTKIISLSDYRKEQQKEAYAWARKEMERIGFKPQLFAIDFDSDNLFEDSPNFIASVFICEELNNILFRRDWLDEGSVKYNTLVNFKEIKRIAPLSAQHLIDNGIKLYKQFNGPQGQNTRRMSKSHSFY